MLARSNKAKHVSFHTPGHKIAKWDVTELSYSDNLSNPKGCIKQAEEDIAKLLNAKRSFILTDGSTSGIFCMLHALKQKGINRVAIPLSSHKSVYNACSVLGLAPVVFSMQKNKFGIEEFPSLPVIKTALDNADALLIVSPNYYGKTADYLSLRNLCDEQGKPLVVDGAHGGHLRYDKTLHAGQFADLWVDGVHKSLPAFTQGAVVSAKSDLFENELRKAVDIFRTTSPSYPIMASVEYAVKYPKNEEVEKFVRVFASQTPDRIQLHEDYTKLCVLFGANAFDAEKYLEQKGVFAEFCDGNAIMFYLSPATKKSELVRLTKLLKKAFEIFAYQPIERIPAPSLSEISLCEKETEFIDVELSEGRVCASACGLFPPCVPLILRGERIEKEKIQLLKNADNTFGLQENKISVFKV